MELEVGDVDTVRIDRAHDVCQPEPIAQAHGDIARRGERLAELREERGDLRPVVLGPGNRVHTRPPDLRLEIGGSAFGDELALVDDPDAICEDVRLLEVLRGQEDGHTRLPPHQGDLVPDVRTALRVEAGGRLVEEEDARRVDQGEREVEPALHPAREPLHLAIRVVRQPDAMQQFFRARAPLLLGDALQRRLQAEVVARREQWIERRFLQGNADDPPDLRPVLHDVVAAHERRARRRRQQRRQDVDGGGLPGAVRAEEAVDLTGSNREVDPVDRARAFLVLADEPADLDPILGLHRPTLARGCRPSVQLSSSSGSRAATTGFPSRR